MGKVEIKVYNPLGSNLNSGAVSWQNIETASSMGFSFLNGLMNITVSVNGSGSSPVCNTRAYILEKGRSYTISFGVKWFASPDQFLRLRISDTVTNQAWITAGVDAGGWFSYNIVAGSTAIMFEFEPTTTAAASVTVSDIRIQASVREWNLDLYPDGVSFPFNYEIADIEKPQDRQHSYSKTITIPGTKSNNKLFGHLYDIGLAIASSGTINFTPNFNPNLKADVFVYADGVDIFRGIMQLLNINVLDYSDHEKVEYQVALYGATKDLFSSIGDGKLEDLNLDSYDHTYTRTNQKYSWDTQIQVDGVNTPFALGVGYIYPVIDYGLTDGTKYWVTNIFPAIYLKTYIDAIFNYAGFEYQSTFFVEDYFKRLIIPFNGEKFKLTNAQITERKFRASKTSALTEIQIGTTETITEIVFNNITTPPNSNPSGHYQESSGIWDVYYSGYYNINTVIALSERFAPTSFAYVKHGRECYIRIRRTDSITGVTSTLAYVLPLRTDTNAVPSTGRTTAVTDVPLTVNNVFLNAGDSVWVEAQVVAHANAPAALFDYPPGGAAISGDIFFQINPLSFFMNDVPNNFLQEEDTVTMASVIPVNIKIKDFLLWVIRMFNLYIDRHPTSNKKVIIDPRDYYYSSGSIIDWTEKLDISKPVDIIPMGGLKTKDYYFQYTDDKDYYNDLSQKTYGYSYGYRLKRITNDFVKGITEIKTGFSACPLVLNEKNKMIVPKIINVDNAGIVKPYFATNMKVLYYAGVKPVRDHVLGITTSTHNWQHIASSGTTIETSYPFTGHIDDIEYPNHDLSFGVPKEVYWQAKAYTNNNLYNRFYKRMIEEITDKDSKTITAYFHLTPKDIHELDFRNEIRVEDHRLRLLKITDYDPSNNESTKCEFIKIKSGQSFTETSGVITGGNNDTISGEPFPNIFINIQGEGNNGGQSPL